MIVATFKRLEGLDARRFGIASNVCQQFPADTAILVVAADSNRDLALLARGVTCQHRGRNQRSVVHKGQKVLSLVVAARHSDELVMTDRAAARQKTKTEVVQCGVREKLRKCWFVGGVGGLNAEGERASGRERRCCAVCEHDLILARVNIQYPHFSTRSASRVSVVPARCH